MSQNVQNVNIDSEQRFAHIDGHTEVDFIPGQNKVITSGIDCEVRVWSLDENDDVKDSFTLDDSAYSVVANSERFFVALANNYVKSFQLEDGENESTVCRFTSNCTCLALHPDGDLLAAAAADFTIKLINISERNEKLFTGHEGPILSVAIDSLKKFIASSSCDGSVCIWSVESRQVAYQWRNIFPRSNDFENSSTLCRIAWQPKLGELFALPRNDSIELYKRAQWDSPHLKLKHSEFSNISIVTFSADGQLLAASSTQSIVMIWKIESNPTEPLSIFYNLDSKITSLKFNPINRSQLCCTDKDGSLRILKIKSENNSKIVPEKNAAKLSQKDIENIFADIDDDDVVADFSFVEQIEADEAKKKKRKQAEEKNHLIYHQAIEDDLDDDIDDIPDSVPETKKNKTNVIDDNDDGDNADFDIGAIKSQYEPIIFGDNDDDNSNLANGSEAPQTGQNRSKSISNISNELNIDGYRISSKDLLSAIRGPRFVPPLRQPSFQSGSTPVHYKQRFMIWNSIGIVHCFNSDEERSIDVEFHDTSFHHSIHLTNMFNYTMADLSAACLLLASNGDDESDDMLDHYRARMFCQLFNTWDTVKEWQIDMPKEELIDSIAAGQNFVAVVTSKLFLRVWTVGGIQTSIVSINGPAVNLSAYDSSLMVLYHSASQHHEFGQSISAISLKVDHKGKTRCHPIPNPVPVALSPKSTVYWAGFTDEGTPCVVDSDGIIRLFKSHFGNGWIPICATKDHGNGKSDNFFIIGLSEIQAQVRCIYCKAARYPDTVPKPTLTLLSLQIPLCEMFSAKAKHEEECLRNRWLASLLRKLSVDGYDVDQTLEESDKKIINSLIKLFALSLGAERESLALEIAGLMPNRNALEGAVRYAERQRHRSLAMKLIEMLDEKDNEEINSGDDEKNSDTELQEFATRKGADNLRCLLKEDQSIIEATTMIPLTKNQRTKDCDDDDNSNSNDIVSKKSNRRIEDDNDDDNDDVDMEEEINNDVLKPVNIVNNGNGRGKVNPFKINPSSKSSNQIKNNNNRKKNTTNNNTRKRRINDSSDDDNNSDKDDVEEEEEEVENKSRRNKKATTTIALANNEDDSSEKNSPEFTNYYESKREQLFEENADSIETEDDLLEIARKRFDSMTEQEQLTWKPSKSRKKKSNTTESNNGDSNSNVSKKSKRSKANDIQSSTDATNNKTNKITNFFRKT